MATIKYAATIILSRGSDHDPEVYLARRAPEIKFFGDYWVFPGGNVNPDDYSNNPNDLDTALRRCAVREAGEEINIALQPEEMNPVFRVTTPPFAPVLYDTQFMHARFNHKKMPEIDKYELVEGRFIKPATAIDAWLNGDMKIAPPVLFLLRLLNEQGLNGFYQRANTASNALTDGELHEVYFSPGIFMAPLATDTIPPATTTNTLIIGNNQLYIVDPATTDEQEQQRLFDQLDRFIAEGKQLEGILLTHHHFDHVGAVNPLSQRYQLPVLAHELCYPRIAEGYIKGKTLRDGDLIELGTAPDGSEGWHIHVLHTPGHAVDHLCFLESRYNAAIVGDMLSTVSTILINPPDGHMSTYLDSLARLRNCSIKTLYPAHGPAHRDGNTLIDYFIDHRQQRETQVVQALQSGKNSLDELLLDVYDDIKPAALAIAARSLLAHLIKLEEEGRCRQTSQRWQLV